MTKRGLPLLEAHIRSFDPDEPTARERLEQALGEDLAQQLLLAARTGARVDAEPSRLRQGDEAQD